MILTPDQRLRVFVSSTLHELAEERGAAREAIESLHLTPVMFEAGARSHPPRALYRAYLDQSDVFVAIYAASYGWVAPDMDISGLEDEYVLSADKPRLVYVKAGVTPEPRMKDFLDRLETEGGMSYKRFADAAELNEQIKDDLMVLLTERFESVSEKRAESVSGPAVGGLPVQTTTFIGRETEIDELSELICAPQVRLLTLIGAGGIGKTRLALEVAARVKDSFRDGVFLVMLADVRDPQAVPERILVALGRRTSGSDSALDALTGYLADKRVLLVLDNFEQVLDAAAHVAELMMACSDLRVIVTSRAPLRIRGEHEHHVPPLGFPVAGEPDSWQASESIRLFVDRALLARPDLRIDEEAARAIAEICERLDGLPLAIELAAARVRILPPAQLLQRLTERLSLLQGGARDMPERHQTLRDTIEWSFDLLYEEAKELFRRLGAFRGGFTLEAAEEICGFDGLDVLTALSALIDQSLVRSATNKGEPRFMMLETVREYATAALETSPTRDEVLSRHAHYFAEVARVGGIRSRMAGQQEELDRFEREMFNMRSSAAWLLHHGEADLVAEALWEAWWGWWMRGYLRQGRLWAERTAEHKERMSRLSYAKARATVGALAFWQNDLQVGIEAFNEVKPLFEEEAYERGLALCDLALGLLGALAGSDPDESQSLIRRGLDTFLSIDDAGGASMAAQALCWTHSVLERFDGYEADFQLAYDLAERVGAEIDIGMAQGNLGRLRQHQGDAAEAMRLEVEALERMARVRHLAIAANLVDQIGELVLDQGRAEVALTLISAGAATRARIGVMTPVLTIERMERNKARARQILSRDAAERAEATGQALDFESAAELALAQLKPVGV